MRPSRVPPPGLVAHPRRDLLLLAPEFPSCPQALEGYAVRPAAGWTELVERVRSAAPASVVLLRVARDRDVARVAELVRTTPSVPVVAAVAFEGASAGLVRAAIAAGGSEVADTGRMRGMEALVPTLRRAHARPLKRRMEEGLPVWVPEDARTLIRAAAETVVDHGGREVFAGIFGLYPRTAAQKCSELDLPPPRRLLGWVRVLLALMLLEEAGRTVLNAARSCGYRDNSSLKRAVENFPGTPPLASIREQRFDPSFQRFVEELRVLRHAGPRTRRAARV